LEEFDEDIPVGVHGCEMRCEGSGIIAQDIFIEEDGVGFRTTDPYGGGNAFYPRRRGQGVHVLAYFEEPERDFLD
jgi:hypothetical protein